MGEYIVTGGTGFIGRNLIRNLISSGNKVYAIVRPGSKNLHMLPKDEKVIPVYSELKELSKCLTALPYDCEGTFHFAWQGVNRDELNDDLIQGENVTDSISLLNVARELGCKNFVFAGSRSEYGVQTGYYTENVECHPMVAYGRAKLEFGNRALDICNNTRMRFLHPRIFSVYGPDDHPWSLISTSVNKMLDGNDMDLSECKHFWNFMYIDDAVDLLKTLSDYSFKIPNGDNCIFNVATRDIRPLKEFVEEIRCITNSTSKLNYGAFAQSAESAVSLLPDMTKVEAVFNWKPQVLFSDGIKNIIRSMEEHNA